MTAHRGVPDSRLKPLLHATDLNDQLRATAKAIAAEHAHLITDPDPTAWSADAWAEKLEHTIDLINGHEDTAGFDHDVVRHARALGRRYCTSRDALFLARSRGCFVRRGAGDVLDDVASLAIDVEAFAGPRAAQRLLRWYHEFSNEKHPSSLAHFYLAHQALRRALWSAGPEASMVTPDVRSVALTPTEWLIMAVQHLEQARPRLVLVGGGPGTGKSTLAMAVSEVVGWPVLGEAEQPYEVVLEQAARLLHHGEPVVIEAPWATEPQRALARATAAEGGAAMVELHCHLDPAVARERLAWQMASPWDPGDDPDAVSTAAAERDPWPEALEIDTGQLLLRCRSDALKAILGFAQPAGLLEEAHALVDEDDVQRRGDHVGDRHVAR